MNMIFKMATVTGFGLALAGCTNMNVFKDSPTAPAPSAQITTPPPQKPLSPSIATQAPQSTKVTMSAAQISKIIAGKSFNWKGPNNSGSTLFAQDGSSLIEVNGKGTTGGKWTARDGQLCESVSPGAILPNGSPLKCNAFSGSRGRYNVGPVIFTAS